MDTFNRPFKRFWLHWSQISNCKALWIRSSTVPFKYNFFLPKTWTQLTKINDCFSARSDIAYCVPHGSTLSPLLFNYDWPILWMRRYYNYITNYADHATPYLFATDIPTVISESQQKFLFGLAITIWKLIHVNVTYNLVLNVLKLHLLMEYK